MDAVIPTYGSDSLLILYFLVLPPLQDAHSLSLPACKMLLGKRPRPHMKRTMSMKDVSVDLGTTAVSHPSDAKTPAIGDGTRPPWGPGDWNLDRRRNVTGESGLASMVSPRGIRWSSADYAAAVEMAPFLRACALCKGFLHAGRDIFMYRGEIAFCSLECREQQIKLDERKEKAKCSVASRKDSTQPQTKASASEASGSGDTAAAG